MYKARLLTFLLLLLNSWLSAQITRVSGTVIDKNAKEPVPFINVIFKGTAIGATTDTLGIFHFEGSTRSDSIVVSGVGYKKQIIPVKSNQAQRIDIYLESDQLNLKEIVVKPGRNPAFRILDKIVAHKSQNRVSNLENYQWQEYEKFQIFFGNYSKKFTDRKQFKDYKFIFDHADSTADGKPLLPIYMSESIKAKFVISDPPPLNKVVHIAGKSTGESYEQLTSIANRMVENVNVYDNFFLVLDKSFISPINDNYQLYYKYYLEDSLFINGQKCFQIRFVPKWKEDLAFSGTMFIHDTTFAVKKIDLQINNEINLNYVKDFKVKQEFVNVNDKWIQQKFETYATISPIKRKQSEEFTVHRLTSYKDILLDEPTIIRGNFAVTTHTPPEVNDGAYWEKARHDTLNSKEKYNYMIADTINYVPAIKKLKKAAITFASGYIELGKISIGQIHTFYSFNPIEQDRYKFGLKTNKYFSKQLQFGGYIAYGSSDERTKYGGNILYVPVKGEKRLSIGAGYTYDLAQMGISRNHIQLDNILTSLTRTSALGRLTFNEQYELFIDKYWSQDFGTRLGFVNTEIRPLGILSFNKLIDSSANVVQQLNKITTSEIQFNARFSFQENVYNTEFKRTSLGSKYPIIELGMNFGVRGLLNADYDYQKVKLSLKGKLRINPIGYMQYNLEGGKTFGDVPYLLTELHPGNQTLVYDQEAFNLMKYFEFASDEYVSLHLDHHFEGFFLNKIPLVKKAQLREVISARGVVGNLHDNVKEQMILPTGLSDPSQPYVECSAGLENIFKVVRIDYIWRMTKKSPVDTENWSIKAKFYFSF